MTNADPERIGTSVTDGTSPGRGFSSPAGALVMDQIEPKAVESKAGESFVSLTHFGGFDWGMSNHPFRSE